MLKNTKGLQYLVNEKLGKRAGFIGRVFRPLELGKREYSQHAMHRLFRVVNFFWMMIFRIYGCARPIGSRFLGLGNGPLNYSGLFCYFFCTAMVFGRLRFDKAREQMCINAQDGVEFWFERYGMMFPPSYLHNRVSAHFIEINNIFFCEMLKKHIVARKEHLAERDLCSEEEQRTKYAMNPNYIFEPFTKDTTSILRLRADGLF